MSFIKAKKVLRDYEALNRMIKGIQINHKSKHKYRKFTHRVDVYMKNKIDLRRVNPGGKTDVKKYE